jgi:hypothetical protein
MDKMKMRMAALGGKSKEMPFSNEAMSALKAKKQGDGMESMLASLMGGDKEETEMPGEEGEVEMEIGELSPEEKMLIMAYRKKKAVV